MTSPQRLQRWLPLVSLIGLLTFTTGCSDQLAQLGFGLTPIESIQKQPRSYTTVYVQGKVGDQLNLLSTRVYQLKDDKNNAIWVLTQKEVPPTGTEIKLQGKVQYQGITFGGQELGAAYVEEIKRL